MELIDYVRILRRRWLLIAVVVVACVGGAFAATKLETPRYSTTARLLVNGSSSVSAEDEMANRALAASRAGAFAQIANTSPAFQAALKAANTAHGGPFAAGSPSVSAGANGTDPFINISVTDTNPAEAQAIANAYVTILPGILEQLESTPVAPNELAVVNQAGLPGAPSSPRPKRNLLIGLALGIVLGGGAALASESLDRRLKDSQDIEDSSGFPVLGVVPYELPKEPIPSETSPLSLRAEAYRKVRTNLNFVTPNGTPKSVVVTSATSSEGKTSLATNLAIAYTRTGQRVALVDADLRRPMVHSFLKLPDESGLVNVLAGSVGLGQVLQVVNKGYLSVLVAGPIPANPSELIGSAAMLKVIRTLERDHDIVIVDTPPVLPVADALLLGVNVDAVVIVSRLGETTKDRLKRAKDALLKVRANVVGVVPNGAEQRDDSAYAYSYRYRRRRKGKSSGPRNPEVEPRPVNLRPAGRSSGDNRGPKESSVSSPRVTESAASPAPAAATQPLVAAGPTPNASAGATAPSTSVSVSTDPVVDAGAASIETRSTRLSRTNGGAHFRRS